ncbi:nucleoporin POM33 KNAG_0I03030 [Huiozyma naganishii CBS 8797]|uniref:Nucleoporin POM33 n=1 Tax=Huiozyma naganishii (strain ATCC MYA-139 / BCRC 22969 / CBS 8797 / KCTC 17520 / NBRC 10181 / NCYC 3082 / Yp74L-3) TaxID=1071383 RepID=J7S2L0_HUIN7|nr:hypothetical protein KNAG_0I03030 [Kazachstania naganishii CBS 8797]CCK72087.1 hypothetical protein KNAG_0I03030 [Kazachstania naganishii CBS 8797]
MDTTQSGKPTESKATPAPAGAAGARFVKLAKSLQFAWFVGHAIVLFSSVLYMFTFKEWLYRLVYLGVVHSFGIIIYQQHFLKTVPRDTASLLTDENILYFALATVWLFTPRFTISLIPYIIFSLFHFARYLQNNFLPVVFGLTRENSGIIQNLTNFTQNFNERCMYWVAGVELTTEVILLLKALVWCRRSWILFPLYSLFIKIRFENSKYSRAAFAQWRVRLDGLISHPSVPPVAKKAYDFTKTKLIQLSSYQLTKPTLSPQAAEAKQN